MSSFSFDFQTLIKHLTSFVFSLSIINEFEKLAEVNIFILRKYAANKLRITNCKHWANS